jgi:transcription elongation factor B subunit 1
MRDMCLFYAAMLSGPGQFAENEANEVNFREIP